MVHTLTQLLTPNMNVAPDAVYSITDDTRRLAILYIMMLY